MQAAMDHLYRIPERARFQIKSDYYFIVRQDVDRALASVEMWADLFPDDVMAYQARVQIQGIRNDREGMLESLEMILELDPAQKAVLLQMGNLHEAMGDLATARGIFQEYADEFPEDHAVLSQLAGVSRRMGNLDEARDYYDRALVLAPSDVGVILGMAGAERALGNFDGAVRLYEEATATAGAPAERAQVHGAFEAYYAMRGQMDKAIEHLEARLAEQATFLPDLQFVQMQLVSADRYVDAGREAEAFAVIEEVRGRLPAPFDVLIAVGEVGIHLSREDADAIEAAIPGVERAIEALRYEIIRPRLVFARGRVHELRGEYAEALEQYEEERRLSPTDFSIPAQLGRCYRELGEHERAIELFQESLRVSPWHPRTNYDIALAYEAVGRVDEARTHLQRSLEVWADADSEYAPPRNAREALERVGM
jgi:tetratricopeptide (TPR) repeat protein